MGQKCTANRTDGEPCQAWAVKGTNVCQAHGGSAPQVKKKAQERIDDEYKEMLPKALDELKRILEDDEASDSDKLKAIENVIEHFEDGEETVKHKHELEVQHKYDIEVLDRTEKKQLKTLLDKAKTSGRPENT